MDPMAAVTGDEAEPEVECALIMVSSVEHQRNSGGKTLLPRLICIKFSRLLIIFVDRVTKITGSP
ncbi:MAG: hypothetical protein LCH72_00760 [Proteobacteria bacterium]|nr:hypothetical protein [Burkholderiales bacterium]MCA0309201.1 hypothetical protein [Pseudomonadota bacterium]